MRIISGNYGGRHLKSLPGITTRPTTDKVKESIFNIIGPYFNGGICLDLFAGSGGLSIEAVSRGMSQAILFEKDRKAQQIIENNIAVTKESEKFTLIKGDSSRLLYRVTHPVDLVFLDPPYQKQRIEENILHLIDKQLVHQQTIIVCETDKNISLPVQIDTFYKWKYVEYGTVAIHVYEGKVN